MENPKNQDTLRGFGFALSAYVLWGFLPLYLKAVSHIPAIEVVAHRVLAGSYTHLRAHETPEQIVCRRVHEKKKRVSR